jgi:hypothetical protein
MPGPTKGAGSPRVPRQLEALQAELRARIRADAALAAELEPEQLDPHVRLLQRKRRLKGTLRAG